MRSHGAPVLTYVLGQAAGDVPVDLLRWLLTLLPILFLLVMLVGLRWGATEAGPLAVLLAAVVAVVALQTPIQTLVVAGAKGVWDALPILLVIFAALLLFRIGTAAGAFHALRTGVQRQSRNTVFLVLAFGWVFASFTQGIAGFGAPIAIVAPILVALRVRPLYAVVIPLIGHAWAKFFGTLGVGWVATLQVTDVEEPRTTALLTSLLLLIPIVAAGLAIAWMVGRMPGVTHALPMVLAISLVLGVGQIGFAFVSPELSTFLAGTLALLTLYPLSRWSRYSEEAPIENLPAMAERTADAGGGSAGKDGGSTGKDGGAAEEEPEPVMGLGWALLPYGILIVISVLVLLVEPIESFLRVFSVALPFPEVSTGYGLVTEGADAYAPLEPLAEPGGLLLFAALLAWVAYRLRGFFGSWQDRADPPPIWATTVSETVPAATAIVTFLVLASVMSHSGQTEVLALGIAAVASPVVYAFLANFIGIIGALVTNSSTSSNVLLAPVHTTVAADLNISQAGVLAAQSQGGAVGNVLAPTNIILGTTTTGIRGQEGAILRKTIPWALVVAVLTGFATILLL